MYDPITAKISFGKSEDTSDKSIHNIFVINSYSRNNLQLIRMKRKIFLEIHLDLL